MHGGYSSAQSTNFTSTDLIPKEEDLAHAMEQQRQELQALAEERSNLVQATTQFQRDREALEVSGDVWNCGIALLKLS